MRRLRFSIQGEAASWHCAARREITRPEGGKLPKQRPRSPRRMVGYGRPFMARPWECGMYDKPSGVVRGECRGGLGGAAAPNRPPSAARRAGGQNNRKRKAPVPEGHENLRKSNVLIFRQPAAPVSVTKPAKSKNDPLRPWQVSKALFTVSPILLILAAPGPDPPAR